MQSRMQSRVSLLVRLVQNPALWAAIVLAAGLLSVGAAGQQAGAPQADTPQADTPPPLPPPGPPPSAVLEHPIPPGQLAFLAGEAGLPAKTVMKDKRFRELMKTAIPRTTYHYGRDMPIDSALDMAMDDSMEPVEVRDGRFVTVSGNRGPYLRGRGFLWFDLQQGIALGAFYFTPTNGEPSPTLTIFSKQLTDTSLSIGQLPSEFAEALFEWSSRNGVRPVTVRYFIPANGKKYVLEHDEDYCGHPQNTPAPAQDLCGELNAEAADADMNAAYFMKETSNAANATAWMLGPDQVAWVGMRESTCGVAVACRIRVTRERTRVLMGGGGGRRR